MKRLGFMAVFASVASLALAAGAAAEPLGALPDPQISYTKTVLANGLTLIVHEDHTVPIVAVNLWYHVGSKNEPPGRTGFAHLFEHLMFGATGGSQRGWFERLEGVGATDVNGTTDYDRTNFFETVPTPALDMTLALEAGRMGHLLDNFNEALLNTQRGVVQNEKREDENEPYAVSDEIITQSVWPAAHPYSHTVIGEMTDLDNAKVEDVKDWFSKFYGPNNAVLVLAGDITPATAKAKVERAFGAIPPGPPVARQKEWIAQRTGTQRAAVQDHVAQARLYLEWNIPPAGSADADMLDLLTDILTVGKDSRLYRRMVYTDQIATSVDAQIDAREIGGLVDVELTAKPGVPLSKLEAVFDEELAKLLRDGPTPAELARYKTRNITDFVTRAEKVGGFSGRAMILAEAQTYLGSPDAWKVDLERTAAATPEQVAAAGRRWMSDGVFVLDVTPLPDYAPVPGAPAAGAIPAPGPPLAPHFPAVRRATLSNGLKLVVAERHATPQVSVRLVMDAGEASDPIGQAGLAALTATTAVDGTRDLDALAFDDRKLELGATLSASAQLDTTQIVMTALSTRLAPSLDLLADVVLHPALRDSDIAREKALEIDQIGEQKADPIDAVLRIERPLVYGVAYPYGRISTEASVGALTPQAVKRYHATWFQPHGATLIVVGDTTLEQVQPLLEARLGHWTAAAPPPKAIAPLQPAAATTVYLIDKPGALQSVIAAGVLAPPKRNPDALAEEAMVTTLGGAFTSRLNMNLREEKHWAYGAFAFIKPARGPSLFTALAPVQTDKTKESFAEVRRELTEVVGSRPITANELSLAQHNLTLSLPGRWETDRAVGASLGEIAAFGLPDDYYNVYAERISALTPADAERAAKLVVKPSDLTWVIVGDRAKVLGPLESLGLKVIVIDANGKPVS